MKRRIRLEDEPNAIRLPAELKFDWDNEEAVEAATPTLMHLVNICVKIYDRVQAEQQAVSGEDDIPRSQVAHR